MSWVRQHYKTILRVIGEIVSPAWTAISLVLDLMGVVPPGMANWELSALIGFIIFAASIGYRIFSLQRHLSPRLKLVFGDFPSCIQRRRINDHTLTLFRVGLINQGGRTIENVQVSLERLEPQSIPFGPIKLWFMHQRQPGEEFSLHPGTEPSLFVDVIEDVFVNDPPKRVFNLRYAVSGVPNAIEPGNYRLILLAEGQDVQPCRKAFLVTWNGEHVNFVEE